MKDWIVADPEHLGGSPRVRGTRISVALILESLAAGMSVAEIVDAYPPSPRVLRAVRAAVDGRLRLYPNPTAERLRQKLARLLRCKPWSNASA